MLEDPSALEDFHFEIRLVPSVVCLSVDSCLLVSLANNRQVRFSMSFLSMLVVQVRRSCRWPLVCPSDRNVPRRCLRMHLCGVVLARGVPSLHQPHRSGRSIGVWPVLETLVLGVMEHPPRRKLRKLEDHVVFGCASISQRTDPRRDVNWSTKWKSE